MQTTETRDILHAGCVALDGRAVLIRGASGSGKSALALQLMALGLSLISDDRTEVLRQGEALVVSAPPAIRGLIEARGIGLLHAEHDASARAVVMVDLDRVETMRLPPVRLTRICGLDLPCLHKIEGSHFPAAILQYLRGGRRDPA